MKKVKKIFFYLSNVSILYSLIKSIQYKGLIIIGCKSRIYAERGSKLILRPKSRLILGLEYYSPVSKSVIKLAKNSEFRINGRVSIKKGCLVSLDADSKLCIGDKTFINEGTKLLIYNKCHIGSQCAISYDVVISDSDIHQFNGNTISAPVFIGDNVWVGFRSSILKGAVIENGCVVASHSLANKTYSAKSLIVGVPGKVTKTDVSWKH